MDGRQDVASDSRQFTANQSTPGVPPVFPTSSAILPQQDVIHGQSSLLPYTQPSSLETPIPSTSRIFDPYIYQARSPRAPGILTMQLSDYEDNGSWQRTYGSGFELQGLQQEQMPGGPLPVASLPYESRPTMSHLRSFCQRRMLQPQRPLHRSATLRSATQQYALLHEALRRLERMEQALFDMRREFVERFARIEQSMALAAEEQENLHYMGSTSGVYDLLPI